MASGKDSAPLLLQSVELHGYFKSEDGSKAYTNGDVFGYNYLIWTLAYFIGLQFTHMDQGIFT